MVCATSSGPSISGPFHEHHRRAHRQGQVRDRRGDASKVRHLEGELKDLEEYKAHHPGDNHDPTPLEVFCDLNPEAPECLVYDD